MDIIVFLTSNSLINIKCDEIEEKEGVITLYKYTNISLSLLSVRKEKLAQFTLEQIKGWALANEVTKTKLA